MSLPLSLTQAIQGSGVLPLLDAGIPDLVSAIGTATGGEALAGWLEVNLERMWPLYETAVSVAHDCVLTLAPHRHLYGMLSADDPRWRSNLVCPDEVTDDDNRLLIDLSATYGKDWFTRSSLEPALWQLARSYAARAPLLLLGCDANDNSIIGAVEDLRPNPYFQPTGWLLTSDPSPATRERWEELGFEVVSGRMPELLRQLREIRATRADAQKPAAETAVRVANPYKHLEYFRREDRALFFGRERETRRLVELVCANRLVIVTGPSGTGKTSLLQAGLLAWCDWHPPFVGIDTRCGENPEAALTEALGKALGIVDCAQVRSAIELLETFASRRRVIPVVVIDQAEELFTRFSESLRDRFLTVLTDCLARPDLHIRLILGIRDDFLARLADVRHVVPPILVNTFYVPALTREAALSAIREPALAVDVPFNMDVARRILDEIGTQRVAPPQIQIVCDSLFRRRDGGPISADLYEKLGGARAILSDFMEQQLSTLASGGSLAREVLKAMVTTEGTKDVLAPHEIARRCRREAEEVRQVLLELRDSCRLVRAVESDTDTRFEVVHEFLTTSIWSWLSEPERERRDIEELLIKEIRAWRQFKTLRLGADRLRRFEGCANLLEYDAEALTLFLLSSVTQHQDSSIWVGLVQKLTPAEQDGVASTLFAYFTDNDINQRCEAAEVIGTLEPSLLLRALDSPVTAHRRGALEMLGGLRLSSAVPRIAQCLGDVDKTCAILSCGALGAIGGPQALAVLVPVARGADQALACAAIAALGRAGFPESCIDLVSACLESQCDEKRTAVETALLEGRSVRILELLLQRAERRSAAWSLIARLPINSRSWLQGVLKGLPDSDLERVVGFSIDAWVGEDVEMEKLRRKMQSKLSWWSAEPILQKLRESRPDDLAEMLRQLDVMDRNRAIDELAQRGNALDEALPRLIAHPAPIVRRAALEIVIAREPQSDPAFARSLFEQTIIDKDPLVRAAACQLAARWRWWWLLDQVIRMEPKPDARVRASALRGLAGADSFIPMLILERALDSTEPLERYWGCLVARERKLTGLLQIIRPLVLDNTAIADTGFYRERCWPGYDATVGHRVADAAHAALAVLAPRSAVWRDNVSWHIDFRL